MVRNVRVRRSQISARIVTDSSQITGAVIIMEGRYIAPQQQCPKIRF